MTLDRWILEALALAGRPVRENILLAQSRIELPEPPTSHRFTEALRELEAKDPAQIAGITTDDGTRWTITTAGKARLAQ